MATLSEETTCWTIEGLYDRRNFVMCNVQMHCTLTDFNGYTFTVSSPISFLVNDELRMKCCRIKWAIIQIANNND